MVLPVLQVAGFEHMPDKPEEPLVADLLRENREHDLMVEAAEAVSDIALDEPCGPGPGFLDLPERGMAAASFPEPVRPIRKARLEDRLQQEADHLTGQFV